MRPSVTRPTVLLLVLAALAGCAARPPADAHVPPFARLPFEPFQRATAVAIAMREWRLFGSLVVDEAWDEAAPASPDAKPERLPGLWQRVGEYWWLGLDAGRPETAWTGKHDERGVPFPPEEDGKHAWSAAFVSYVMRIAGAGKRFPYSAAHADYIDQAREASLGRQSGRAIRAERPEAYAPLPGDLICYSRGSSRGLRFDDLPAGFFPAHCDIVVGIEPGLLSVVGGNVQSEVAMKHVPTTLEGRICGPDGLPLDTRYAWFVAIRVLYDG